MNYFERLLLTLQRVFDDGNADEVAVRSGSLGRDQLDQNRSIEDVDESDQRCLM